MLADEATSLDSSQLTEIVILVGSGNLEKEEERFGLVVELLLKNTSGIL